MTTAPQPYRCDCGEMISTDMPHVEEQPDFTLWHGNAQGGGHASNFDHPGRVDLPLRQERHPDD